MSGAAEEQSAAKQAGTLPPPPVFAAQAQLRRSLHLTAQLRQLREKATQRAGNAQIGLRLAGLLLFSFSAGLTALHVWPADVLGAVPGLRWGAVGVLLGLAGLAGGLLVMTWAGRLEHYFYRRAWQAQLHCSQTRLLADEERLQLIQQQLPARFWGAARTRAEFRNIGERLEFATFHLPCLSCLELDPEGLRGSTVKSAELARWAGEQFDKLLLIWAGCCAGMLLPPLWLLLAAWLLLQAPRVIAASAALCAFIDHYLEEPRIELEGLPPAPAVRSWLSELLRPWLASA